MKTMMKNLMVPFICLLFLLFVFLNYQNITSYIANIITKKEEVIVYPINEYAKKDNFLFVQSTEDFTPFSKGDLKNIFYTIVNNGWDTFTFYCPSEYKSCLQDVKEISQNQDLLTHLNNYVHPFNGFSNVKTNISESGEISVSITYSYTQEEIDAISKKVDELYQSLISEDMDTYTKILTIHDYIINTTKYDVERNNQNESNYHSYSAYGPLFEGYATCNGYTDVMALFLEKLEIPNFKVAMTKEEGSNLEGHVWNALYYEGKWVHLDLTWDDPVSNDGKDYLQHKYFLITTSQLKEIDSKDVVVTEHQFKENIYIELKE